MRIDPTAKRAVIVKSMQHFYAGFAPIAAEIVYVVAPGAIVPDFTQLPYQRPADPVAHWRDVSGLPGRGRSVRWPK